MSGKDFKFPKIFTVELHQDDPAKCTSAKMRKFGYAKPIARFAIPPESLVLSPVATDFVVPSDREKIIRHGLVVIDCSWNLASGVFNQRFKGVQRKLPLLLAGNPTNYSKPSTLSSIEAVAASLFIASMQEYSRKLLSLYKWGDTFLTLNQNLLSDYSHAESNDDVRRIELEYFPNLAGSAT